MQKGPPLEDRPPPSPGAQLWAAQVALVVKNLPARAGDGREVGFILSQEDPLEKEMAIHSSILA